MKLARVPQAEDLVSEVRRRFADFNRSRPPTKGRRYPGELRQLVCQAAAQGCKVAELGRLTGLSPSGLRRWLPKAERLRPESPRRLEVVAADTLPTPTKAPAIAVVVRLPSGVTFEFADGRALTGDLVSTLIATEVRHAAAR